MSTAEVRELLAKAASTVEGMTGHPYFVQTTLAGNVMVRLDRIEYPNRFGGVAYWNMVLVLPQDQAIAEKFADDNVPALREALADQLTITSVQPQRLQIEGLGILPTVFINGHREEE